MSFTDEELDALDVDRQRIGIFFRLATEPDPLRIWLGVGKCKPGINAIDPTNEEYSGFGELTNVPEFQSLINGAAERVDFTLSGVSQRVANIATVEDAPAVKNKDCLVGYAIMDQDWQFVGPIHWNFRGVADYLGVSIQGATGPDSTTTRTIKLSVGNGLTGRKRRGFAYWTDQDNQTRSPGDLFCQFVAKISMIARKVWPKF